MTLDSNDTGQKVLIYQADDGHFQTRVRLDSDTIWLTQKQMSDLFGTSVDNIGLHLKNIYAECELQEKATTEDYSVVRQEGSRKKPSKSQRYYDSFDCKFA